jgi:hypothetical protein
MLTENIKKVLVALRSGEYKQGKFTLQSCDGYCCLGVMCDVYEKETGDKLERDLNDYIIGTDLDKLPKVQRWVGLKNYQGDHLVSRYVGDKNPIVKDLTGMNDIGHYNFSQIADHIESKPEGLLY